MQEDWSRESQTLLILVEAAAVTLKEPAFKAFVKAIVQYVYENNYLGVEDE